MVFTPRKTSTAPEIHADAYTLFDPRVAGNMTLKPTRKGDAAIGQSKSHGEAANTTGGPQARRLGMTAS